MNVTIIPIRIGALSSVTKGLLKGLDDMEVDRWVETIETTVLLRMDRILRRVLETWWDLLSLKLQLMWKTLKGNNNNNNNNMSLKPWKSHGLISSNKYYTILLFRGNRGVTVIILWNSLVNLLFLHTFFLSSSFSFFSRPSFFPPLNM